MNCFAPDRSENSSLCLSADQLSAGTGNPVKTTVESDSKTFPAWILPHDGGRSCVSGVVTLPEHCAAIKVKVVVTAPEKTGDSACGAVFRVYLKPEAQDGRYAVPVRAALASVAGTPRTVELESFFETNPSVPLWICVERDSSDSADTFCGNAALIAVRIEPAEVPPLPTVVRDAPGYNTWPMIQTLGKKLVCVYSRGSAHKIEEGCRGVYAKVSEDGGRSWEAETLIDNIPDYGEVPVGKGLDENGAMLLWVRCCKVLWYHDLYRSTDGVTFTRIATPELNPMPMQITDVFAVPTVGLMALWFAGYYLDDDRNSWGTLISRDNGLTWEQHVVEEKMRKIEWPTEPSAVYLGNGRILAVARTENHDESTMRVQFQLESCDFGKTWSRTRTNIGDVCTSTPSLILDRENGMLSNYYYHRGRGILKRRVVAAEKIWNHPLDWPDPEILALGSPTDAGNSNSVAFENTHVTAYYSRTSPTSAIVVTAAADAPHGETAQNEEIKK